MIPFWRPHTGMDLCFSEQSRDADSTFASTVTVDFISSILNRDTIFEGPFHSQRAMTIAVEY